MHLIEEIKLKMNLSGKDTKLLGYFSAFSFLNLILILKLTNEHWFKKYCKKFLTSL